MLPTRDGWFGLSLARESDVELIPALVGDAAVPEGDGAAWQSVARWLTGVTSGEADDRVALLGLAGGAVPRGPAGPRRDPVVASRGGTRQPGDPPLVLDFTSLWAGPLCGSLLAATGARVIKVESAGRPDGARRGPAEFFDLLNGAKESVMLDFADQRDQLRELVGHADVVLEASRPRALRQLGLDADEQVAQERCGCRSPPTGAPGRTLCASASATWRPRPGSSAGRPTGPSPLGTHLPTRWPGSSVPPRSRAPCRLRRVCSWTYRCTTNRKHLDIDKRDYSVLLSVRSPLRTTALIAALSGLAVLTACSGTGVSDGKGRTLSCTSPGVTESEVKAGLLFSDSGGGQSAFGAYRAGVDARLGIANAAGGVNGRKVVYNWYDDASDSAQNLFGAQKLVQSDAAFGIIEGTAVASGSAQYLDSHQIPVVGVGGNLAWAQYANMFAWSYYTTEAGSTSVWGDLVRSRGGTRAVLVDTAMSDLAKFHRQLAASLQSAGVQVVQNFEVTAGTANFNTLVQRMKAANIDTLTGSVFPDVLAAILPAARAAGVNLKVVLAPLGYDPKLLHLIGPALAGTVIYLDFAPFELNSPEHARLLTAMATYAPQIQNPAQESAAFGWLSADMFLRGLQAAGACPTRAAFVTGLRAVHDYDGGGLLPSPIDFATNRGQLSACYDFVQVSDDGSHFVPLQPVSHCGRRLP